MTTIPAGTVRRSVVGGLSLSMQMWTTVSLQCPSRPRQALVQIRATLDGDLFQRIFEPKDAIPRFVSRLR